MPAPLSIPPSDIVVFGETGEPAVRQTFLTLLQRHRDGLLPRGTRVVSVSPAALDDIGCRVEVFGELRRSLADVSWNPTAAREFVASLHHVTLDPGSGDELPWHDLAVALPDPGRPRFFHVACRSTLSDSIAAGLRHAGLLTELSQLTSATSDRPPYPEAPGAAAGWNSHAQNPVGIR